MECPICGEEMTSARLKDVEFDDGNNDITVTLCLTWCPECKHKDFIEMN